MRELTLTQQIALECDIDSILSKAKHKTEEVVECFLILSCSPEEVMDNCVEIMKKRIDPDVVDKVVLNLNTLTIPYGLLADRAVEDIKLLKGISSSTPKGTTSPVAIKDSIIKGKLVAYLREIKKISLTALDIILSRLDQEFPEYKEITFLYSKEGRSLEVNKNKQDVGMDLIKALFSNGSASLDFQREASLLFISLAGITPINSNNEFEPEEGEEQENKEDSAVDSYIVEVKDTDSDAIFRRREFKTIEEAKEYKKALEDLDKDDKGFRINIIRKCTHNISPRKDSNECNEE